MGAIKIARPRKMSIMLLPIGNWDGRTIRPGSALPLRFQFRARVRVRDDEFFVVVSWVAPEHQSTGVAALKLDQKFFVFLFQTLQYVRIQDDPKIVDAVLIFAHDGVERPMKFNTGCHRGFTVAGPAPLWSF